MRRSSPLILVVIGILIFLIPMVSEATLVNINTADQAELETLVGIGAVKAVEIIEYRTVNGPFETIEEIMNVSGIGEATFAGIKDFITVGVIQDNTSNSGNTSTTTTTTSGEILGDSTSGYSSSGNSNNQSYVVESNAPGVESLYASAGRARTVSLGVPSDFVGWVSETKTGKAIRNAKYEWSFGDGSYGVGIYERHTYRNPGDYVVVLRGYYDGKEAISRTTVKVLPINVEIVSVKPGVDGSIVIYNNSLSEANLGDVSIVQGYNKYTAPRDTILLPKSQIELYRDTLWFVPENVLTYIITPAGQTIDTWSPLLEKSILIREEVLAMSEHLDQISREANHLAPMLPSGNLGAKFDGEVLSEVATGTQMASKEIPVAKEIIVHKKEGFFTKLWNKLFK